MLPRLGVAAAPLSLVDWHVCRSVRATLDPDLANWTLGSLIIWLQAGIRQVESNGTGVLFGRSGGVRVQCRRSGHAGGSGIYMAASGPAMYGGFARRVDGSAARDGVVVGTAEGALAGLTASPMSHASARAVGAFRCHIRPVATRSASQSFIRHRSLLPMSVGARPPPVVTSSTRRDCCFDGTSGVLFECCVQQALQAVTD